MNYSFIQPDNFRLAKKQFSRIGFSLTLMAAAAIISQLGCALILKYYAAKDVPFFTTSWAAWLFTFAPMYLVAMPLFLLVTKNMPQYRPAQYKLSAGTLTIFIIMCFPIMIGGSLIGSMLSFILSFGNAQNVVSIIAMDNNPLKILFVVIIAPMFEEYIFRKTIIDRAIGYGEKTAIVFSALMFGLFHMNLFQFFYAFGIGLIFGYVYVRTGKIRYSIIMHAVINFFGSVVSPFVLKFANVQSLAAASSMNDPSVVLDMLPRIGVLMLYLLVYYGIAIAGLVLLIVRRKRFVLFQIRTQVYGRRGFKAVYINAGVILFFLVCLGMIIRALFVRT